MSLYFSFKLEPGFEYDTKAMALKLKKKTKTKNINFCFILGFGKMFENFIQEYTLNGLKLMPSISAAKIKVKCLFKLPKKPGIMKFLCHHTK